MCVGFEESPHSHEVMSALSYYETKWQSSGVNADPRSPVIPRNNPFWGEDAVYVIHSPEMASIGDSRGSGTIEASDPIEEEQKTLNCDIVTSLGENRLPKIEEIDGADDEEMAALTQLTGIGVVDTERFITLPEEYQLFQKDSDADLTDLCSSFHQLTESQPVLSDLNAVGQPSCSSTQPQLTIPDHPQDDDAAQLTERKNASRASLTVLEEPTPRGRRTRTSTRKQLAQMNEESLYNLERSEYHTGNVDYVSVGKAGNSSKRRRNSSEHSIISSCSFDDGDGSFRRKRRRYEEEPSDDPAFEKSRKNAIIAKRNREKKKQLMEQMESRCDKLTTANDHLESENIKLKHRVETLEEEVHYMKSILANQSSLSQVLSHLKVGENQLRLSTSFDVSKYKKASRTASNQQLKVSGGICLHVDGSNQVSLEMCQKCSQMACGAPRSAEASGKNKRSA